MRCSAITSSLAILLCFTAAAQDAAKNYKELDQDALKLFKEGKYEEARKIWRHINYDYPRAEFRSMRDNDPRFIAWQIAFHTSVIREAFAEKQVGLQSPDAAVRAKAETAYTKAVEIERTVMSRKNVSKATQDKLIKAAEQPLLDALKKKDDPGKK